MEALNGTFSLGILLVLEMRVRIAPVTSYAEEASYVVGIEHSHQDSMVAEGNVADTRSVNTQGDRRQACSLGFHIAYVVGPATEKEAHLFHPLCLPLFLSFQHRGPFHLFLYLRHPSYPQHLGLLELLQSERRQTRL